MSQTVSLEGMTELKPLVLQGVSANFVKTYIKATVSKSLDIRGKNTKDGSLNGALKIQVQTSRISGIKKRKLPGALQSTAKKMLLNHCMTMIGTESSKRG